MSGLQKRQHLGVCEGKQLGNGAEAFIDFDHGFKATKWPIYTNAEIDICSKSRALA